MKPRILVLLLLSIAVRTAIGQLDDPGARWVEHFDVLDSTRLVALAKLGSLTSTSFLVEAGEMSFLQARINIQQQDSDLMALVNVILSGPESYGIRRVGALLVISPARPNRPLNRILSIPLRRFSFRGTSLPDLTPYLGYALREASGCKPTGYGYAGPAFSLTIPKFELSSALFEDVVAQVATGSQPTMWIVAPDPGGFGCMADADNQWEVVLYGFGRNYSRPDSPISGSLGPPFL